MRIRKKFLQLTKFTYPNGTEKSLKYLLPKGYKEDGLGNYYIKIGENPTSMFTCHLDTACSYRQKVNHLFEKNMIKTDGRSILGADDKAGMVVILYMIENNIPGIYYFFVGEEVGCIGSSNLFTDWHKFDFLSNINKVVSFDRRGTKSVITHQMCGRCCSDEFASTLSVLLNEGGLALSPDDTGIVTDSAQFVDIVPECTNISVGYYNEHTYKECQDIEYLNLLCKSVCKIDWESLPIKRDPKEIDDDYLVGYRTGYEKIPADTTGKWSSDNWTYIRDGDIIKKMYISDDQIKNEKGFIYKWIFSQDSFYELDGIEWNGNELSILQNGISQFIGYRRELIDKIPELATIPMKELSDYPSVKKSSGLGDPVHIKREFLF